MKKKINMYIFAISLVELSMVILNYTMGCESEYFRITSFIIIIVCIISINLKSWFEQK